MVVETNVAPRSGGLAKGRRSCVAAAIAVGVVMAGALTLLCNTARSLGNVPRGAGQAAGGGRYRAGIEPGIGKVAGMIPGFVVRWRPARDNNPGVVVEIDSLGGRGERTRGFYYHNREKHVMGIEPWTPPVWNSFLPQGVMLSLDAGTGNSREYVIVGQASAEAHFRIILDVECDNGRFKPEFVDLDGDTEPEIVSVASLAYIYGRPGGVDTAQTMAEIWKWSSGRGRYVLVKRVPYLRRLAPLRLKRWR